MATAPVHHVNVALDLPNEETFTSSEYLQQLGIQSGAICEFRNIEDKPFLCMAGTLREVKLSQQLFDTQRILLGSTSLESLEIEGDLPAEYSDDSEEEKESLQNPFANVSIKSLPQSLQKIGTLMKLRCPKAFVLHKIKEFGLNVEQSLLQLEIHGFPIDVLPETNVNRRRRRRRKEKILSQEERAKLLQQFSKELKARWDKDAVLRAMMAKGFRTKDFNILVDQIEKSQTHRQFANLKPELLKYAKMYKLAIPEQAIIQKMRLNSEDVESINAVLQYGENFRATRQVIDNVRPDVVPIPQDKLFAQIDTLVPLPVLAHLQPPQVAPIPTPVPGLAPIPGLAPLPPAQVRVPKKKNKFPRRKHELPSKEIRPIFIKRIKEKHVARSSFWCEVISNKYDDMFEIDTAEMEYRLSRSKNRKVKYDGYWYMKTEQGGRKICEVQRGVVIWEDGQMDTIIFDSRWDKYSIVRDQSQGKYLVNDYLLWENREGEQCLWRRWTNVHALQDQLWVQHRVNFDPAICNIIQMMLGINTWQRQKEKKRARNLDEAVRGYRSKRVEQVLFFLRLLHLRNDDDFYRFRDILGEMNDLAMQVEYEISDIRGLKSLFPTQEELANLVGREITADSHIISRFFRVMGTLPNISQRIDDWGLKAEFFTDLEPIERSLHLLETAQDILANSESLKMMFGLILKATNYVNGRMSHLRNAYGFSLGSLERLPRPLLEYVVLEADKNYPDALNFVDEFDSFCDSRNNVLDVDFNVLTGDFNEIKQRVNTIRRRVDAYHLQCILPHDKYLDVMGTFIDVAEDKVEEVQNRMDDVVSGYRDLAIMFCCSHGDDFDLQGRTMNGFVVLQAFRTNVQRIQDVMRKTVEQQEARKKLQVLKLVRREEKKSNKKDKLAKFSRKKKKPDPFQEILKIKEKLDQMRRAKEETAI